jgi:hypothetical protein
MRRTVIRPIQPRTADSAVSTGVLLGPVVPVAPGEGVPVHEQALAGVADLVDRLGEVARVLVLEEVREVEEHVAGDAAEVDVVADPLERLLSPAGKPVVEGDDVVGGHLVVVAVPSLPEAEAEVVVGVGGAAGEQGRAAENGGETTKTTSAHVASSEVVSIGGSETHSDTTWCGAQGAS